MLTEIYIDIDAALHLLESAICLVLDSRVMHEGVDYLRECAHTNVVCFSTIVAGEGTLQKLLVSPPHIFVPGYLSIGKEWKG